LEDQTCLQVYRTSHSVDNLTIAKRTAHCHSRMRAEVVQVVASLVVFVAVVELVSTVLLAVMVAVVELVPTVLLAVTTLWVVGRTLGLTETSKSHSQACQPD
jgi:hypothetical protein